ncbi:MAG TPA: CDP-glycerol glycerophosphotransferase family protein [Candidatus Limnocylindria bacterium]|nr:CDP-glycerol glycerophosphotransferase family protein [Candidatus Limnocylindria bacterium]
MEGIRRLTSDAAASVPIESRWQVSEQDIVAFNPDWLVFWSDSIIASQLAVWLPYLRRSRYRFVVASGLDQAKVGVGNLLDGIENVRLVTPVEALRFGLKDTPRFKGVLYPTSRPLNFAIVTMFPRRPHVWIGHGESEKLASSPRTASMYDAVLMARLSGVERFSPAIRGWLRGGACAIGAPIVEGLVRDPGPSPRPVKTLLYAPTWEGHQPKTDYSSLSEVGPILTAALPALQERGIRVVFRPHPGTGRRDPAYREHVKALFEAGASRPGTKAEDYGAADVMLSDVSGATAEFLFTEKPVVVPVTAMAAARGKDAESLAREYPWAYRWPVATTGLLEVLDGLGSSDPMRQQRARSAADLYRGHRDLEHATRTFDTALSCVGRRGTLIGVRRGFELKLRAPLVLRVLDRFRRSRRRRRASGRADE